MVIVWRKRGRGNPPTLAGFVPVDFAGPSGMATASFLDGHLRRYGINAEANPSRCSICRRMLSGRLPCGVAWTVEDTAAPGGTGVAMKAGDSNGSGWNVSPTM